MGDSIRMLTRTQEILKPTQIARRQALFKAVFEDSRVGETPDVFGLCGRQPIGTSRNVECGLKQIGVPNVVRKTFPSVRCVPRGYNRSAQ